VAKYFLLLKNQVSLLTAYRFDLAWRWVSNLFEIVVYVSLWSLTSAGGTDIRRLLTYYILFFGILHNLQSGKVSVWMGDDISSGNLNQYLIKPINFPLVQIIKTTTILISRIVSPVIFITIGSFVFPQYLAPASPTSLILFLIFAALGFVIWNLLMVIIGSLAFWLTEIRSLTTVLDLILSFVKGAYIPVYLFSNPIRDFLSLTPFNYLTAFPTDIYLGLVTPANLVKGFTIIAIWIAILATFSTRLYSAGVRRYEAYG